MCLWLPDISQIIHLFGVWLIIGKPYLQPERNISELHRNSPEVRHLGIHHTIMNKWINNQWNFEYAIIMWKLNQQMLISYVTSHMRCIYKMPKFEKKWNVKDWVRRTTSGALISFTLCCPGSRHFLLFVISTGNDFFASHCHYSDYFSKQ